MHNSFQYKMIINADMFTLTMKNGIRTHVSGTDIITKNVDRFVDNKTTVYQQISYSVTV